MRNEIVPIIFLSLGVGTQGRDGNLRHLGKGDIGGRPVDGIRHGLRVLQVGIDAHDFISGVGFEIHNGIAGIEHA